MTSFVYLRALCGSGICIFNNHKGHEGAQRKEAHAARAPTTSGDLIRAHFANQSPLADAKFLPLWHSSMRIADADQRDNRGTQASVIEFDDDVRDNQKMAKRTIP
jgi:hypothetical protein